MKGDNTVNIVFTPHFPNSPELSLSTTESLPEPRRLFENSSVSYSSEWTSDSSSNDWTTDSEVVSENEFRWSATP